MGGGYVVETSTSPKNPKDTPTRGTSNKPKNVIISLEERQKGKGNTICAMESAKDIIVKFGGCNKANQGSIAIKRSNHSREGGGKGCT